MKTKLYILVSFLLLTFSIPVSAKDKEPVLSAAQQQVRLEQIHQRIVEIRQMDRSAVSQVERQEIRKELKEMRKELRKAAASGGNGFMAYLIVILGLLLVVIILY